MIVQVTSNHSPFNQKEAVLECRHIFPKLLHVGMTYEKEKYYQLIDLVSLYTQFI